MRAEIAAIFSTIRALCTRLPVRTPRQLTMARIASTATATGPGGRATPRDFLEIGGEGHRHRGHASRLDDEQEHPAIEKRHSRVVGLAQVCVLPADLRHAARELGVDERPGERDQPPSAHAPRIRAGVVTWRATT